MRVKTETMVQKKDGTRIYEPRTIQEVFNDIKKILTEEGLCPEEYFTLSYPTSCHADEPFPEISGLFCNAQWGGSEGIYLDIAINVFDSEEKNYKQISFITGKLCLNQEMLLIVCSILAVISIVCLWGMGMSMQDIFFCRIPDKIKRH